jgi:hypothetical protein
MSKWSIEKRPLDPGIIDATHQRVSGFVGWFADRLVLRGSFRQRGSFSFDTSVSLLVSRIPGLLPATGIIISRQKDHRDETELIEQLDLSHRTQHNEGDKTDKKAAFRPRIPQCPPPDREKHDDGRSSGDKNPDQS